MLFKKYTLDLPSYNKYVISIVLFVILLRIFPIYNFYEIDTIIQYGLWFYLIYVLIIESWVCSYTIPNLKLFLPSQIFKQPINIITYTVGGIVTTAKIIKGPLGIICGTCTIGALSINAIYKEMYPNDVTPLAQLGGWLINEKPQIPTKPH